jgi:hypothetical protein
MAEELTRDTIIELKEMNIYVDNFNPKQHFGIKDSNPIV